MINKKDFKKDFYSGIFFLGLGLFLAFKSTQFSVWDRSGPQAGSFPLGVAVIMIGVSLFVVVKSLTARVKKKGEMEEIQETAIFESSKFLSYVILMLFYSLSFESVGFVITSALFLVLVIKLVEKESWRATLLVGSVSIIVSYILFGYLLSVPLPKGLIKWL
jgi:putative tricarboxylic transport membrane protein